MTDDGELLRMYVRDQSERAFTALVRRHLDFVYSTALRRVGGDSHLAQDVSQKVFTHLTHKAPALLSRKDLSGWLFIATRYAAIDVVRSERRRKEHEGQVHFMSDASNTPQTAGIWEQMRPVLDEVLDSLSDRDREAILLRFSKALPFTEVGAAIGVTEEAARKRVDRAIEKLRAILARRGITSTTAALCSVLGNQSVVAAPAGLAATIAHSSFAVAASAGPGVSNLIKLMSTTKVVTGIIGIVAITGAGSYWFAKDRLERGFATESRTQNAELSSLRAENLRLRRDNLVPIAEETPAAAATSADGPLARTRLSVDMIRSGLLGTVGMWSPPAPGTGVELLVPEVAQMLELTGPETAAVQRAVETGTKEFTAAFAPHASVQRTGDQVVISIDVADRLAAQAAYDRMMDSIARTLGSERYGYLETMGITATLADRFTGWGLGTSSWTITKTTTMQGSDYYTATYQSIRDPATGAVSSGMGGVIGRERLNALTGPLQAFIPAGF